MLNVEWISSGKAWPDHSFKRIPPSDGPDGPSQTLRMSWPTSVSKTMKWRLKKGGLGIHHKDQRNTSKNDLNSLSKTGSHSLMFAVTMANRRCCIMFYLPDSLARISFYYPCAVEIVVIWSWISWRQNPSRHCSGDVASTLGCRDTRRNHACSVQQDVNQDANQATKGKLGILRKY